MLLSVVGVAQVSKQRGRCTWVEHTPRDADSTDHMNSHLQGIDLCFSLFTCSSMITCPLTLNLHLQLLS